MRWIMRHSRVAKLWAEACSVRSCKRIYREMHERQMLDHASVEAAGDGLS
jgi:hypothetical protein